MSKFGTFWHGPRLSAFEASCLQSFLNRGQEISLFSYEPVDNVPKGVQQLDARLITDESRLQAFKIGGKPSISHFSDYFRLVMFGKTDMTWVDTDILLLGDFEVDPSRNLLALETDTSICNAVLRIAPTEPVLPLLLQKVEGLMNTEMRWGETGPRLLTKLAGGQALAAQAKPAYMYFPIHFDDFWKVFLPEHYDECVQLCQRATTLHLWNNIVDRLGFWKELLPPEGSYLHRQFIDNGCAPLFKGEFPLKNMRQLVENWQSRQTGQHLGIKSVVTQALPSIVRTFKHYAG